MLHQAKRASRTNFIVCPKGLPTHRHLIHAFGLSILVVLSAPLLLYLPRVRQIEKYKSPSFDGLSVADLSAGEGKLKNSQQILSQHLELSSFSGLSRESCANRHLCNNKANLLTRLVPCCNKILGTGPRMTGARIACFVLPASFVLCLLFSHTSFFLKKLAKTSVAAKNMPLIRHLEFAERERDLLIAYFSSFFPHTIGELFNTQSLANSF